MFGEYYFCLDKLETVKHGFTGENVVTTLCRQMLLPALFYQRIVRIPANGGGTISSEEILKTCCDKRASM